MFIGVLMMLINGCGSFINKADDIGNTSSSTGEPPLKTAAVDHAHMLTKQQAIEDYNELWSIIQDNFVARNSKECGYKGSRGIWQYKGDGGRCDGVTTG